MAGQRVAFETDFGWVLAGSTGPSTPIHCISHHVSLLTGDDILRKFWEIEEKPMADAVLSSEERSVMQFFKWEFCCPTSQKIRLRSQAIHRFYLLNAHLSPRDSSRVVKEYFDMGHAEKVPIADMQREADNTIFYLPIHAVRKESSTTTKLRAVFDASAKSSTGISLNDTLLVGPLRSLMC